MNAGVLQKFTIPQLNCIAVALDFSKNDENLIANALSQGNTTTRFLLLHIVESPSARAFGENSDDFETRKDRQHLQSYVEQLQKKGFLVEGKLGYRHRTKEIVRIVKEANADMLVMGAHFHTGVFDYLYGETVDKVRHQLRIPVLVVS
jgi:manganese transport protein